MNGIDACVTQHFYPNVSAKQHGRLTYTRLLRNRTNSHNHQAENACISIFEYEC